MMEKVIKNTEDIREIEILEFIVGGNSYGVDISDIKEILPYDKKPRPIPNSHPYIEGIVMPRNFIIPVINLSACLKLYTMDEGRIPMLLVTSINDMDIGFHVDIVRGLHRTTTNNITKTKKDINLSISDKEDIAGILIIGDKTLEVLDFRRIITEINPNIVF